MDPQLLTQYRLCVVQEGFGGVHAAAKRKHREDCSGVQNSLQGARYDRIARDHGMITIHAPLGRRLTARASMNITIIGM